jgi:hypothetical protein
MFRACLICLPAADEGKRSASAKTALLAVVHHLLGTLPLEYTYAQHGGREEEAGAAGAAKGVVEQLAGNVMLQQPAAGMVAGMPILPGLQPTPMR